MISRLVDGSTTLEEVPMVPNSAGGQLWRVAPSPLRPMGAESSAAPRPDGVAAVNKPAEADRDQDLRLTFDAVGRLGPRATFGSVMSWRARYRSTWRAARPTSAAGGSHSAAARAPTVRGRRSRHAWQLRRGDPRLIPRAGHRGRHAGLRFDRGAGPAPQSGRGRRAAVWCSSESSGSTA
jgi:hypothetical protein